MPCLSAMLCCHVYPPCCAAMFIHLVVLPCLSTMLYCHVHPPRCDAMFIHHVVMPCFSTLLCCHVHPPCCAAMFIHLVVLPCLSTMLCCHVYPPCCAAMFIHLVVLQELAEPEIEMRPKDTSESDGQRLSATAQVINVPTPAILVFLLFPCSFCPVLVIPSFFTIFTTFLLLLSYLHPSFFFLI